MEWPYGHMIVNVMLTAVDKSKTVYDKPEIIIVGGNYEKIKNSNSKFGNACSRSSVSGMQ